MVDINEPRQWDFGSVHDLPYQQRQSIKEQGIEWMDPVYTDLPPNAAEGIEGIISGEAKAKHLKLDEVNRLDPQTLELVYFEEEYQRRLDKADRKTTYDAEIPSLDSKYKTNVEDLIQDWFGPQWLVRWKPDERFRKAENPRKLLVRRMEARRFKYEDEREGEYHLMLHGTPDGVAEGSETWGDLDQYDAPEDAVGVGTKADFYVYETSTGTQHLVRAKSGYYDTWDGLRDTYVTESVACDCGHEIGPDRLASGDRLTHYSTFVKGAATDPERKATGRRDPEALLDDLCGSCWRSYARTDGEEVTPPDLDYNELRGWA